MSGRSVGLVLAVAVTASVSFFVARSREFSASGDVAHVPRDPQGRVGFRTAHVDLGDIQWGEIVPFELAFFNGTNAFIEIVRAAANCDCTVIDPPNGEPLRPRTQVLITGYVEVGRKPGRRSRTVSIELSDQSVHRAQLEYRVLGSFVLEPEMLDFGVIDLQQFRTTKLSFSIHPAATPPIEIMPDLHVDADWIECQVAEMGDASVRFEAIVIPSKLARGLNTARIQVETSDPVVPKAEILAKVIVKGDFRAAPEVLLREHGEQGR